MIHSFFFVGFLSSSVGLQAAPPESAQPSGPDNMPAKELKPFAEPGKPPVKPAKPPVKPAKPANDPEAAEETDRPAGAASEPGSSDHRESSQGTQTPAGSETPAGADATAGESATDEAGATAEPTSPAPPLNQPPAGGPPAAEPPPGGGPGIAAEGGAGLTPLPPPPAPEDPSTIAQGPWRGRFWFGARLDLLVPLAGEQPAKGHVVGVGGAFAFGWRINNWLGLHTGLSTVAHSADRVRYLDQFGNTYSGLEYGQLLAFELIGARFYVPLNGAFQPYLDVAGGPALLFQPDSEDAVVGGVGTGGIGFDGWLSPNFSLGADVAYRLIGLAAESDDEDETVGHGLRIGAHLGVHW